MGQVAAVAIKTGETVLIHTGGMVPDSADAVVMVEYTQPFSADEIEVRKPAAPGENVIQAGEDVQSGAVILPAGHRVQPQDVGALLALGIVENIRWCAARVPACFRPGTNWFRLAPSSLIPARYATSTAGRSARCASRLARTF